MSNCTPTFEAQFKAYLGGALSAEAEEAFEAHCFECEACAKELMLMDATARIIKSKGPSLFDGSHEKSVGENQDSFFHKIRTQWNQMEIQQKLAIAATILLLATATILLVTMNGDGPQPERFATGPYMESPNLEGLVQQHVRSEREVVILSPENFAVVEHELEFAWEKENDAPLFLVILNHADEEVFQKELAENRFLFENVKEHLPPGRYYWKLHSEEKLFHVGVFFVGTP